MHAISASTDLMHLDRFDCTRKKKADKARAAMDMKSKAKGKGKADSPTVKSKQLGNKKKGGKK